MRNNRGFSLVEVMVTSVVITVVVFAVAQNLKITNTFLSGVRDRGNRDRVITNTLRNVVRNVSAFQKNFNLTPTAKESMFAIQNLPLAWNQSLVAPVAECTACPGRMGFIIEPLSDFPGLNRLTIRLTHKTLIQGHLDYVFILADD